MAKVIYTCFCREFNRNKQTGLYSFVGRFVDLAYTTTPIVFVVYWQPNVAETFRQFFTLVDEVGHLLDETPTSECVLKKQQENISTAIFYTIFPRAGRYHIRIHQDGVCTDIVPIQVNGPW